MTWDPEAASLHSSPVAKVRTSFLCRACGGVQPKWMGKCPDCGAWDALEKYVERPEQDGAAPGSLGAGFGGGLGDAAGEDGSGIAGVTEWISGGASGDAAIGVSSGETAGDGRRTLRRAGALPQQLSEIALDDVPRLSSGIAELDRVLGGGLVPGSVVLLGGDPGVGKSTLLLQSLAAMARRGSADRGRAPAAHRAILYVSSEESPRQIRLRAERLLGKGGAEDGSHAAPAEELGPLHVLAETNLARIVEQARRLRPVVCAIDSIQMVYRADLTAAPGSVTQLRRCCADLVQLAKRSGMAILVVGHVTKDGKLAGPKLLEHLVDVVLSFEGDRHHAYRIVRALKNRFGDTQELGLFEMAGDGLREVSEGASLPDPLEPPAPGTAICPTIVGSRCLLAEAQALTATGILGAARRKASGVDASRLAMLIAVLERHGGLRLADQDIFVSAAGGLRLVEPAADLAIVLAIAGVHYGRALAPATAVFGEVALTGAIRPVAGGEKRLREALRLGYRRVILAADERGGERRDPVAGAEIIPVRRLSEAIEHLSVDRRRIAAKDRTSRRDPVGPTSESVR